jgi:phosphoenolpyruvate carboxylase
MCSSLLKELMYGARAIPNYVICMSEARSTCSRQIELLRRPRAGEGERRRAPPRNPLTINAVAAGLRNSR